ncbi:MAG: hypothetical protein GY702_28575 [Desulfobulbaceae bacterium]|nr:hypothetical protein [Desulfobulbaceae bacterium]
MNEYTYTTERQEDSQIFAAKCNEIPWLSWFAETEEKAIEGIKNIVYTIENQFFSVHHSQ